MAAIKITKHLVDQIIDVLPKPFCVRDVNDGSRYVMCNQAFAELFGRPKDEILGKTDYDIFPKEYADGLMAIDRELMESGRTIHYQYETPMHSPTGGFGTVLEKWRRPFVGDGQRLVLCIVDDISETRHRLRCEQYKSDVVSFLARRPDAESFRDYFAHRLLETERCDRVMLYEKNRRVHEWHVKGMQDCPQDCLDCPLHPDVLCIGDDATPSRSDVFDCRGNSCRAAAMLTAKVYFRGEEWGRLAIQFVKQPHVFSDVDRRVMRISTDMLTMALEQEAERARALQAEKAKSFFFASVSHDIRTPLNSIIGFSELLKTANLDAVTRERYLDNIINSGNTLMQLINDVLDLAKLEADSMTFKTEPCDFAKLAEGVMLSFLPQAEASGISLRRDVPQMPSISIDCQRIRQILFNLLGNALKFTNEGSITLRASFTPTGSEVGTFRCSVVDTGIGIAPEDIARLARPFVQLNTSSRGLGTGLGLSICRQMLQRMGGRLEIESELGKGSVFAIVIDGVKYGDTVEPAQLDAALTSTTPDEAWSLLSVLLVDDVDLNLKVLQTMCGRLGLKQVVAVHSAEEALTELQLRAFDLVLTDMWMPGMDGNGLLKRIRADAQTAHIPVYAVTADVETVKTAPESGFTGVLLKPITLSKLSALLREVRRP